MEFTNRVYLNGRDEQKLEKALKAFVDLPGTAVALPGDAETPMLEKAILEYGGGDREAYYFSMLNNYPQKENSRFTQPREVAETIFSLASPSLQAITGACLSIDFGLTAGY